MSAAMPTDEQVAAAVVALVALAGGGVADSRPRSLWADRSALVRAPLMAGAGSWRASALPR